MAAVPPQPFPFLALPLELRMIVYRELLSPNEERPLLLYHDQSGRPEMLDVHPSILRVNSQIYIEASPILYDLNIFKIDLSSMVPRHSPGLDLPEVRSDHLSLFRSDTAPNNLLVKPNGRCVPVHSRSSGLIYPHCFQRLRHLELVTSHGAVWGSGHLNDYISTTGDLILEILRYLAKRAAPDGQCKKTFRVTTKLCVRRPEEKIFTVEDSNPMSRVSEDERLGEEEKQKLNNLLQAVNKQRKVTVIEDLCL
ncbi:hypothetical protein MMC17_002359 [Xylographa soralifera]|nr:hypothetical protein [Xylographa soralifera]